MALPLLLFVGVLSTMQNVNNAIGNALALSILLTALTDCLVKLSLVSPLLLIADVALAGLLSVIAAFGTFATAVGALMSVEFLHLEDFLNKGLPILEKISTSIGTILGNLVAGFTTSISNALPVVGQNIASFIKNVSEAGSIDPNLADSLKKLAEAVLFLTGAAILDAFIKFISFGNDFTTLGSQLSTFANNAKGFINTMSNVKPSIMDGVKSLSEAVLQLTAGNFLDSLTKIFSFGKKDLGSFGNGISSLATGLNSIVEKTKDFKEEDLEHAKKALEVFKEITEIANDIPNEGGALAKVTGDNKLDDFASKFYKVGEGLRDFVWQLNKDGTFGKYQVESAKKGMEAFKAVLEVAKDIPNEGGAAAKFAGENDIYHFAEKLWKVGEGIRDFVWQLNKDGVFDETAVQRVWAAKDLLWAIVGINDIHIDKSSAGLEELGARLSSFAGKIGEYVGKFKDVKDTELSSAKTKLEKVVSMFTNFAKMETELEGTSFDNISGKIEELGARLASFAGKIGDYVGKFKDVKDGDLTSSKTKIEKIFGILSDLNEGLKNAETTSLEDFSNKLSNFTVLRDILWTIKDLQEVDTSSIAGKLEESAGTLTNFSNKISEYLGSMSLYTLDDISAAKDKIDKIVELVKAIANMTNGEQQMDLDLTSSNIETLGARLISFSNKLSEFLKNMEANVTAEQISSASTKMTAFIELVKSLAGVDFSQIEMTENQMTNLKTISEILWAIKDIGEQGNLNTTSTNIEALGDKLNSFAEKFKQFVGIMKNDISSEDVEAAKTKIATIIEMVNSLKDVDMESLTTFGDNLKTFAESSLDQFITGLQNKDKETSAIDAIKALISAVIDGIGAKLDDVKTAGTDVADAVKTALDEYDTSPSSAIYAAGKAFVQGFVNGINDNAFMATTAGKNLGSRALTAAQNAIDSHSPSKETLKLGRYFGQGFIIGINEYSDKVYDESYAIANKAKAGLSKAISKVSNLISDGIDDDITIRPVLDLSNIESGAAAINGMFNTPSIGIASNLNAISTNMRNPQNNETEMVTAIDRLSKNLGNTNSNTYNINGITYDDGTEVSEAVRTLVRAARIERRT